MRVPSQHHHPIWPGCCPGRQKRERTLECSWPRNVHGIKVLRTPSIGSSVSSCCVPAGGRLFLQHRRSEQTSPKTCLRCKSPHLPCLLQVVTNNSNAAPACHGHTLEIPLIIFERPNSCFLPLVLAKTVTAIDRHNSALYCIVEFLFCIRLAETTSILMHLLIAAVKRSR